MMRFSEFEIDPDAGVLKRAGVRVKLQDLPFRLLVVLLRQPGTPVTREALRAELWGRETFVDAEAGLNTAIAKLREALGDEADAPRFIETLPKRGYRFVGAVARDATVAATTSVSAPPSRTPWRSWLPVLIGLSAVVIALAAYSAWRASTRVVIAVVRFHNETGVPEHDRLAGTLTDAVVVSLAGNPRYGVIGNSPLLRTDRIFQDVKRIGGALNAEFVVLGQLQNGDRGLVARAHFIRVSDETHLWAGKVDLAVAEPERAVTAAVADGIAIGLARR
jgi:DNA-binding winged helix-turn-helix (wHTH) protein/TolB-like protein